MKKLALITLSVLLAAPAIAEDGNRCLIASQVNGFSKATRDSIVLSAGAKDFLVTFTARCIGIEDALSVAAVSAMTCFDKGDKIVFDQMGMRETCFARDVTFLPKAEKPAPKTD